MTTRPDGQMGIAAAFARVRTPGANKRTRSKQDVQDLVTPKPPPSNKKKEAARAAKVLAPTTKASGEIGGTEERRSGEPTTKASGDIGGGERETARQARGENAGLEEGGDEKQRAKRAARSQEDKDADQARDTELKSAKRAARSQEKKDAVKVSTQVTHMGVYLLFQED
eukprot:CAMPEP_0172598926 /NCGR_PEP_ID=MMETSP1068-20121228/19029_1 /TAXON_ID=35684 /ORGANISM="Pseudopedinella elastica, Strain CCMP716" /LENGTH=168 /DNA_ID=CAMNT_0013399001 /DNA_START=452 /DNA_END=958 /DNA_ORIENTATION=+